MNRAEHEEIRVASLMTELEASVRDELRKRVLAPGGAREYADPEIFNTVEPLLRRATESKERGASLLLELIGDDPPWRLRTHIRLSSHRRVAGPLIIFVKRPGAAFGRAFDDLHRSRRIVVTRRLGIMPELRVHLDPQYRYRPGRLFYRHQLYYLSAPG